MERTKEKWVASTYGGGWDCVRDGHGDIICKLVLNIPAHAGLIAQCVNSHDDLLRSDEERKSYAITIKKIWAALGVMDYKSADGKSIDELVLLIKQQRDDLLAACVNAERVILQSTEVPYRQEVLDELGLAIARAGK